jgi:hypothetical protein
MQPLFQNVHSTCIVHRKITPKNVTYPIYPFTESSPSCTSYPVFQQLSTGWLPLAAGAGPIICFLTVDLHQVKRPTGTILSSAVANRIRLTSLQPLLTNQSPTRTLSVSPPRPSSTRRLPCNTKPDISCTAGITTRRRVDKSTKRPPPQLPKPVLGFCHKLPAYSVFSPLSTVCAASCRSPATRLPYRFYRLCIHANHR